MSALGMRADGKDTPANPQRYFHLEGSREYIYPSSDIVLSDVFYRVQQVFGAQEHRDVKQRGLLLMCLWLAGMAFFTYHLGRAGLGHGLALIADPLNTLFLNTYFSEFTAFACLTALVGLSWTWLAGRLRTKGAAVAWLCLLAFLSTNRQQYAYIPLVAVPVLLWAVPWARNRWVA
ncbi:MAG TPA: hypothetical protein VGC24_11700, partial [Burkholderiaceae bacterium]